jgi:hypothetical protein
MTGLNRIQAKQDLTKSSFRYKVNIKIGGKAMKIIYFEGTPQEFELIQGVFADMKRDPGMKQQERLVDSPKEAIRTVLTRIPVSPSQGVLFKVLSSGPLGQKELLNRLGWSEGGFAGVLGGLGRRVHFTKEIQRAGLPQDAYAILKWEKKDGESHYALQPDALEVLKEENII